MIMNSLSRNFIIQTITILKILQTTELKAYHETYDAPPGLQAYNHYIPESRTLSLPEPLTYLPQSRVYAESRTYLPDGPPRTYLPNGPPRTYLAENPRTYLPDVPPALFTEPYVHFTPPTRQGCRVNINWVQGLREATYRSLNKAGKKTNADDNYHLRNVIYKAVYVGNYDPDRTYFGDVSLVAKGTVFRVQDGYKFVEDVECLQCNKTRGKQLVGLWTVKHLRHWKLDIRDYEYSYEYKISLKRDLGIGGIIDSNTKKHNYNAPGHVYKVKICEDENVSLVENTRPQVHSVWVHKNARSNDTDDLDEDIDVFPRSDKGVEREVVERSTKKDDGFLIEKRLSTSTKRSTTTERLELTTLKSYVLDTPIVYRNKEVLVTPVDVDERRKTTTWTVGTSPTIITITANYTVREDDNKENKETFKQTTKEFLTEASLQDGERTENKGEKPSSSGYVNFVTTQNPRVRTTFTKVETTTPAMTYLPTYDTVNGTTKETQVDKSGQKTTPDGTTFVNNIVINQSKGYPSISLEQTKHTTSMGNNITNNIYVSVSSDLGHDSEEASISEKIASARNKTKDMKDSDRLSSINIDIIVPTQPYDVEMNRTSTDMDTIPTQAPTTSTTTQTSSTRKYKYKKVTNFNANFNKFRPVMKNQTDRVRTKVYRKNVTRTMKRPVYPNPQTVRVTTNLNDVPTSAIFDEPKVPDSEKESGDNGENLGDSMRKNGEGGGNDESSETGYVKKMETMDKRIAEETTGNPSTRPTKPSTQSITKLSITTQRTTKLPTTTQRITKLSTTTQRITKPPTTRTMAVSEESTITDMPSTRNTESTNLYTISGSIETMKYKLTAVQMSTTNQITYQTNNQNTMFTAVRETRPVTTEMDMERTTIMPTSKQTVTSRVKGIHGILTKEYGSSRKRPFIVARNQTKTTQTVTVTTSRPHTTLGYNITDEFAHKLSNIFKINDILKELSNKNRMDPRFKKLVMATTPMSHVDVPKTNTKVMPMKSTNKTPSYTRPTPTIPKELLPPKYTPNKEEKERTLGTTKIPLNLPMLPSNTYLPSTVDVGVTTVQNRNNTDIPRPPRPQSGPYPVMKPSKPFITPTQLPGTTKAPRRRYPNRRRTRPSFNVGKYKTTEKTIINVKDIFDDGGKYGVKSERMEVRKNEKSAGINVDVDVPTSQSSSTSISINIGNTRRRQFYKNNALARRRQRKPGASKMPGN